MRFMASEVASRLMRALAEAAGVEAPSVRWRYAHDEPWFDNQVAMLELDGRKARMVLEKTVRAGSRPLGAGAEARARVRTRTQLTHSSDAASLSRKERANAPGLDFLRHVFVAGIIIG